MVRALLEIPKDQKIADEDGNILPEWQRQLEELFEVVQNMANSLDSASGSAAGGVVDTEWNAFVNSVKQD